MSKKTRTILIIAGVLILLLLAVVLPGKAKAMLFGLLVIFSFIALFGGLVLGLSYLNEVVFPRPRHPSHICHHCLSLFKNPEEENCVFCQGEFGLINPLYPLSEFLTANTTEDIQVRLEELQTKLKTARGRNILFIEHDIKLAKRLLRMKQPSSDPHQDEKI